MGLVPEDVWGGSGTGDGMGGVGAEGGGRFRNTNDMKRRVGAHGRVGTHGRDTGTQAMVPSTGSYTCTYTGVSLRILMSFAVRQLHEPHAHAHAYAFQIAICIRRHTRHIHDIYVSFNPRHHVIPLLVSVSLGHTPPQARPPPWTSTWTCCAACRTPRAATWARSATASRTTAASSASENGSGREGGGRREEGVEV